MMFAEAPSIVLDSDDELLGVFPEVTLREPRAVRVTKGYYAGQSIRVTKGVSFRTGGYRSSGESHDELRLVDRGTLVVTSQRLVFLGPMRTSSVLLEKIVDMEGNDDELQLHRQGKEKVEYYKFSGNIEMPYQCDGKSLSAPVSGNVVKLVVAQAIRFRLHPKVVDLQPSSLAPPPAISPAY